MRTKLKEIFNKVLILLLSAQCMTGCGIKEIKEQEKDSVQEETEREEAPEEILPDPLSDGEDAESFSMVVISPEGEKIEWAFYSEGCYCYSNGSLYGYLSEDGEEITPCIYEEATPFSEGLACVYLDGKYGYIGKDGETVLPFIYDQASPFREGAAYFSCEEEFGLIDREGNVVLELPECDSISSFREGLACFSLDGQYGYMDKDGNVVIEPVYDDAGYFFEGVAVVMKDGFGGVIGKDGREILPPEYIGVSTEDTCIIAQKEEAFYLFDIEGNEISSGAWDQVSRDGNIFYIDQDNKRGFADRNGNVILEPVYENVIPIPEKELVIAINENYEYGILDYEGEIKVPFLYSEISYPDGADGGFYVVDAKTGKAGYLDGEDFSVKIPAVYDSLSSFTKEWAAAVLNEKYGIVRYDGTVEMPIEYDRIVLYPDGSMAVWTGTRAELTDRQGNRILTGDYDYIYECGDGYETGIYYDEHSYWDRQGTLIAHDNGSMWDDAVLGAGNSHILSNGTLIRIGEEREESAEEFLLTNRITPRAGAFMEYLKGGTIAIEDVGSGYGQSMEELRQYQKFSKLYRMGEEEELILFFYAEPWIKGVFPESYSGFFAVRDGQAEQLICGNECGGSMRGDRVCFWYDTKEDTWKPGTQGDWGGFGGYASGGTVYELKNKKAVPENSFLWCSQITSNYTEDTLLENAELFYDENGMPYTKETVLEAERVEEYTVNERQVSRETYDALRGRYRYFQPVDY